MPIKPVIWNSLNLTLERLFDKKEICMCFFSPCIANVGKVWVGNKRAQHDSKLDSCHCTDSNNLRSLVDLPPGVSKP